MNFRSLKSWVGRNWHSIPGWRTSRKIIVFESDDWGSIRMPSKDTYDSLLRGGVAVNKSSFLRYDSLASEEDLTQLLDLLSKFRDGKGRHPVFTVNTVMANPDFDKIRQSNFTEYHYELFTETLKRYPAHQRSFKLWRDGVDAGLFYPQCHGREHLNVSRWLKALNEGRGNIMMAFNQQLFDLSRPGDVINDNSFMDALTYTTSREFEFIKNSIEEGLKLFYELFGYHSRSFIAPRYVWDPSLEPVLMNAGVQYIQGGLYQKIPLQDGTNGYDLKKHHLGQRNSSGQIYLIRNCYFEPSDTSSNDIVGDSLKRISTAFYWKKPAIISTHRLNYIGWLDEKNRQQGLKLLETLLSQILIQHPDVEFMTTSELGDLILGS